VTIPQFFTPTSAEDAYAVLASAGPGLVILGGGTLAMGPINDGKHFPSAVLSLARAGLAGIADRDDTIEIGAMTPFSHLADLRAFPALGEAIATIGGPALRAQATIGGNLFAPSPAGDLGVALLALDAEVQLLGASGYQWGSLSSFFEKRPPASETPAELVTRLRIPRSAAHAHFHKLGRRRANSSSVVSVGVRLDLAEDGRCQGVRIALGAAGPTPFRATDAEQALVGQIPTPDLLTEAANRAMAAANPETDALASAWYRTRMAGVMVERALASARAAQAPQRRSTADRSA